VFGWDYPFFANVWCQECRFIVSLAASGAKSREEYMKVSGMLKKMARRLSSDHRRAKQHRSGAGGRSRARRTTKGARVVVRTTPPMPLEILDES
jgi:hypothetical protein